MVCIVFYAALKAERCYSISYLHNNYCLFLGVKMLVEGNFGMNINEKIPDGRTPLKIAKNNNHFPKFNNNDIVRFLESKGAKKWRPVLSNILLLDGSS